MGDDELQGQVGHSGDSCISLSLSLSLSLSSARCLLTDTWMLKSWWGASLWILPAVWYWIV